MNPELDSEQVVSFPWALLTLEASVRVLGLKGWELIIRRNEWFQRQTLKRLRRIHSASGEVVLFSYSYTARKLFEFAKQRGWRTVLGQIDPGPPEERIVERLQGVTGRKGDFRSAPAQYWQEWREECRLADRIVVNSDWSRRALLEEGVAEQKLDIIPLAFDPSANALAFRRTYPERFCPARPMRVLFLGQVNLRKGISVVFEAVRALGSHPIEFQFVGPVQVEIPVDLAGHPRIRWYGPVSRRQTEEHYRAADLFLFPTFSDGFGLTQLEARAWSLPVIASEFCGKVVEDRKNGRILRPLTSEALVEILLEFLHDPGRLAALARPWDEEDRFSLAALSRSLLREPAAGLDAACLKP